MFRIVSGLIFVLLMVAGAAAGERSALRVRVPVPRNDAVSDQRVEQFRQELARAAGLAVELRAFDDLPELLALCRAGQVDLAIIGERHGRALMRECGFELLALSELWLQLYRRQGAEHQGPPRRLGLVQASDASRVALAQWPLPPEAQLTVFSRSTALLDALFAGNIDAAVLDHWVVSLLAPALQARLQAMEGFRSRIRLFIVVTPQLTPELRRRLQTFYLENAAVADWFERDFGLGPPQPPTDKVPP